MEEQVHDLLVDEVAELLEHRVPLLAVLDERVLLGHRAQVHALAQVVHVLEVLAPAGVDDLEDHVALELAHERVPALGVVAELLLLGGVHVAGVLGELVDEGLARLMSTPSSTQLVERDVGAVQVGHRLDEPVDVPVVGVLAFGVLADDALHRPRRSSSRTSSERSRPSSTARRCS